MERWLLLLRARREELERAIFAHPPENWVDFQRRLGRYQELTHIIDEIEGRVKSEDAS